MKIAVERDPLQELNICKFTFCYCPTKNIKPFILCLFRMLGDYLQAYQNFQTSNKLDYDDAVHDWLKEVTPNVSNKIEI